MASLIVPDVVPSPREDAEKIRNAVQGFGTHEKALISVIGHRNAAQRQQIRQAYQELYNEDLIKRLESELTGDLEKAVYRWMHDPVDRDAILAHAALKNLSQNYKVIIEIACAQSPDELFAVKRAYQNRYKYSLEEDVASHSSGDLRKILVALVSTHRYDGSEVNASLASSEANILHDAIKQKVFNHEDVIRILGTRSKAQLNATFNRYRDVHGASITKELVSDPADEIAAVLQTVVRCIRHPAKYFEKMVGDALKKTGTDEDDLTRVIVRHAERNLEEIKELYYKRNSVPLDKAVAKETSGDYKTFLLTLLGCAGN
ncbi:Annexin-like protein rj4 [Thalictrum thalictroides]|uniref:Annexin-like protein rj4 n=1 Tax=Thalictrum thalictroides TaxID=46969 RepID=A0A7J6X5S2_THATH|nr:Annexin-like protein rj4 [Thalictrum thalictroides]